MLGMKRVFLFYLQLLFETFLILKEISEIKSQICIGLHVKYSNFCQISTKLEFA